MRGAKSVDIPNEAGAKAGFLHVRCGLLPVNIGDLNIPDVCICCGAEADYERVTGACKRCRVHQLVYGTILFCVGALAMVTGFFAIEQISLRWPTLSAKELAAATMGLGTVISSICLVAVYIVRPSSSHTHWGSPMDCCEESTIIFNAEFASKLAQDNRLKSQTVRRLRVNLSTMLCLLFLFPAIPAVISYTSFDGQHITVYVDK